MHNDDRTYNHCSCKCSGQFRIAEASRNTQSEERDPRLAMECNVDEKPGENGNAESRGEDIISPASYVTAFCLQAANDIARHSQIRAGVKRGTSAITTQRWEDDGGIYHDDASNSDDTKFFRRIHVICMMIMEEKNVRRETDSALQYPPLMSIRLSLLLNKLCISLPMTMLPSLVI